MQGLPLLIFGGDAHRITHAAPIIDTFGFRYAALYAFGGVYMDDDAEMMTALEQVMLNTAIARGIALTHA